MLPVTSVPTLLAVVERVLAGQASLGEHGAQRALDQALEAVADRMARWVDEALGGDGAAVRPRQAVGLVGAPSEADLASCSALAQELMLARSVLDGIPGGPELGVVSHDLDALAMRLQEYVQAAGACGSRPLAVAALRRLTLTATQVAEGHTV